MKAEKQICLFLPQELFEQVKSAADEDFMAVNSFIRVALVTYLRNRESKND